MVHSYSMESIVGRIKDIFRKEPELSRNSYSFPFAPNTPVEGIEVDIETHQGPYRGAIDFDFPESPEKPILIRSARKGVVTAVVDIHDQAGPGPEFAKFYNYIQMIHDNDEMTEYGHIAKGSAKVEVGDVVAAEDEIAISGMAGRMTRPHLHFLVYRLDKSHPAGFRGLTPRFIQPLNFKRIT